jgi:hypothetical protein
MTFPEVFSMTLLVYVTLSLVTGFVPINCFSTFIVKCINKKQYLIYKNIYQKLSLKKSRKRVNPAKEEDYWLLATPKSTLYNSARPVQRPEGVPFANEQQSTKNSRHNHKNAIVYLIAPL